MQIAHLHTDAQRGQMHVDMTHLWQLDKWLQNDEHQPAAV